VGVADLLMFVTQTGCAIEVAADLSLGASGNVAG
jgi:hypothetical protein